MVFKVFEKLPTKIRMAVDSTLIIAVLTAVYQGGVISDEVSNNTRDNHEIKQEIKVLVPKIASIAQSNADLKDQQKQTNDYLRQLLARHNR